MLDPSVDPRVALQITRYHTWPRVRDQNNGEHSAQIMRIMITVWPEVPRRLLVHAVLHDIGEMTGDVQYPYKKNTPGLKAAMDVAEAGVREKMVEQHGIPRDVVLSDFEENFFKVCEYLEMWEWSLQEMNLGNRYGQVVAMRCLLAASERLESIGARDSWPDLRPAVKRYVDNRTAKENSSD